MDISKYWLNVFVSVYNATCVLLKIATYTSIRPWTCLYDKKFDIFNVVNSN